MKSVIRETLERFCQENRIHLTDQNIEKLSDRLEAKCLAYVATEMGKERSF